MSLDQRLRDELEREAAAIEPDVERHLGAVEAGARRRGGLGASTLLVAAAVVVAAIILRFSGGLGTGPGGVPVTSVAPSVVASLAAPPSTPASYPQIAGTYTATLDPANATVQKDGVAGTWTMRLEPTGAVDLSPPPAFAPGANALTGVAFSLAGDQFRTDLFYNNYCDTVGNYVWNVAAGHLTLASVDDTCSIRKSILATTAWLLSK